MTLSILFWVVLAFMVVVLYFRESENAELQAKYDDEFDRYFFGVEICDAHVQAYLSHYKQQSYKTPLAHQSLRLANA